MHEKLSSKAIATMVRKDKEKCKQSSKGLGHIVKQIESVYARPLLYVGKQVEGEDGAKKMEDYTEPKEVDPQVRKDWKKIYDGNAKGEHAEHAEAFMNKYGKYMYRQSEEKCSDITPAQVAEAFRDMGKIAAGIDSWEPAELSWFSDQACKCTARLYNMIEKGAKWPEGAEKARAAFLEQDSNKHGQVMNYRILLMLSALCRKWAAIRLSAMQPWINKWAMGEMYAGAGHQGAEYAWYKVALHIENMRLQETEYCGGTAAIM